VRPRLLLYALAALLVAAIVFIAFEKAGYIKRRFMPHPAKKAEVPVKETSISQKVGECIRDRVESARVQPGLLAEGERIYDPQTVSSFYEQRTYRPLWCCGKGAFDAAQNLLDAIGKAGDEGLGAEDYHTAAITALLEKLNTDVKKREDPELLSDLELLLTDAFFAYATHLHYGRVNPESITPDWRVRQKDGELSLLLERTAQKGNAEEALMGLLPEKDGYTKLKDALGLYREIEAGGGWKKVSPGPKMEAGPGGERILQLRERLSATGDFALPEGGDKEGKDAAVFDEGLMDAVKRFQQRHGLEPDGVVGPATLEALNVPVSWRIRQIELNMERMRWLPGDLGRRHIIVNIANYGLDIVEAEKTVLSMKVVVGKKFRSTPVFSETMTYLVFNPYWHIPKLIAVEDKLPETLKNPGYLKNQGIRVFKGWGAQAKEVGHDSVDWASLNEKNFPYRLRQDPGPKNALGRVKFMFPNKYNVYLHDTPSQGLFKKNVRAFSSGCIRIEKPADMAEYALRGEPNWSREKILSIMKTAKEKTVKLPEPIPVHLIYLTAWVSGDGSINFRNDIYKRDKALSDALLEPPSIK
jgi:murein L,D-transpeptidase YcbB/YkuD